MKVLYIKRNISHYVHDGFAKSVNADMCVAGPSNLPPKFYSLTSIFRCFRFLKYDAILCEGMEGMHLAYWIKKFNPSVKLIYLDADPFFYEGYYTYSGLKKKYIDLLVSSIDGVTSDSKLSKYFAKKIVSVPIEVTYPFFNKLDNFGDLKSSNILYLGYFRPEKNVKFLIDAFRKLGIKSTLFLVGGEGSEYEEIKKNVENDSNIIFLGYVEDLSAIVKQCGFIILPSRFEPFGCSVLEGVDSGLLPILNDDIGAKEVFDKKDCLEIVYKNGDFVSFKKTIAHLLSKNLSYRKKLWKRLYSKTVLFDEKTRSRIYREKFMKLIKK